QRIVRAKRTLADKRVPFEVPRGAELAARLSSVLEVIYLIFNEGYAATAGDDWMRPALCEEALRLGRVLAGLMPGEPEVHGLVVAAGAAGEEAGPAPRAGRLPSSAQRLGGGAPPRPRGGRGARGGAGALAAGRGPYTLQAAIAACHARAKTPEETDWPRIVAL